MNTEEKIIQAAFKKFSGKGYAETTTKEIADTAGVNEVTLFRKFGNKKTILSAVIQQYSSMQFFGAEIMDVLSGEIKSDLLLIAKEFFQMARKHIRTMLMIIVEAWRIPEIQSAIMEAPKKQNEFLSGYLKKQIQAGKCRKNLNPEITAQAFFALFFERAIGEINSATSDLPPEQILNELVNLFINGITSD